MVNIFNVPVKETINCTMQSKSIMVVGKSKSGKSTIASQAPRPIFLMTENGGEALTGFTPIPIASWSDFKSAVNQLCTPQGRQTFDTVVIDTYTNLILLLDKYVGAKLSTEKNSMDFGSDADYGKGTKAMRNELGIQLQKLANQGYLMLNIVHAEDKTDFDTGKNYIGTSLSNSLYGVAEKFVDQIVYLRRDESKKGVIEHRIWFNSKGGFNGAGGRFTPDVDSVPCSYANLESALLEAMQKLGDNGAQLIKSDRPSVVIEQESFDFNALMEDFKAMTTDIVAKFPEDGPARITSCIEKILGPGKKVNTMTAAQGELLAEINTAIQNEFNL